MSSCREQGATILRNAWWKGKIEQTKASKRGIPIESKGKIVTVRMMKDQRSLHREAVEPLSLGSPELKLDLTLNNLIWVQSQPFVQDVGWHNPKDPCSSKLLSDAVTSVRCSVSGWTSFFPVTHSQECRQEGGKFTPWEAGRAWSPSVIHIRKGRMTRRRKGTAFWARRNLAEAEEVDTYFPLVCDCGK